VGSGCTYKAEPIQATKGPFCADDCTAVFVWMYGNLGCKQLGWDIVLCMGVFEFSLVVWDLLNLNEW
jgi:hypothetical protein